MISKFSSNNLYCRRQSDCLKPERIIHNNRNLSVDFNMNKDAQQCKALIKEQESKIKAFEKNSLSELSIFIRRAQSIPQRVSPKYEQKAKIKFSSSLNAECSSQLPERSLIEVYKPGTEQTRPCTTNLKYKRYITFKKMVYGI